MAFWRQNSGRCKTRANGLQATEPTGSRGVERDLACGEPRKRPTLHKNRQHRRALYDSLGYLLKRVKKKKGSKYNGKKVDSQPPKISPLHC